MASAPATSYTQQIDAVAEQIRGLWSIKPTIGIVLGTGLGDLADSISHDFCLPYEQIGPFPQSTALSHQGRLIGGTLDGTPVIAMQGRFHLYEGYTWDEVAFPIHVLGRLGIQMLITSNASGGVNPKFSAGELMLIEDHINLTWHRPALVMPQPANPRHPHISAPLYCRSLICQARQIARRNQIVAHQGVYVALTGPNYETRAEYRAVRRLGGDVVGMSTIPEVIAAALYQIPALAFSVVTNVATPDCPVKTDAQDVVDIANRSEPQLTTVIKQLVALHSE